MQKELLLYSHISSYTAGELIAKINEVKTGDLVLRINSPGGNPDAAWGLIAKMKEIKDAGRKITIKVDGRSDSAALFTQVYGTTVEALNVSKFRLHRAAYYDETGLTAEQLQVLAAMNDDLKSVLKKRIKEDKLQQLKGVSLDDVFALNTRVEVELTAQEALQIGLIDKITEVTDQEMAAINELIFATTSTNPKPITMTLDALKAQHPSLVATIAQDAVTAERDRVGALLAFIEADQTQVIAKIKDGGALNQTLTAELTTKLLAVKTAATIVAGNPPVTPIAGNPPVVTTPEKTAAQKEVEAVENKVMELLGIKPSNK